MEHSNKRGLLSVLLLAGFCLATAMPKASADSVPPDSFGSNPQHPGTQIRETGTPGAPISLYLTNNGTRITNANGQEVRFSGRVSLQGTLTFNVPGMINGLVVTDSEQVTGVPGDPLDPGHLFFAPFTGGVLNPDGIGNYLAGSGHDTSNPLDLPDFLAAGFNDVYYGVNIAQIGSNGNTFVGAHSFGDTFTLSAPGVLSELPDYIFSSTPLIYTPGSGYSGTPLPAGTQLSYIAFHDISSVPEPGVLAMLGAGASTATFGLLRRKRRSSTKSR